MLRRIFFLLILLCTLKAFSQQSVTRLLDVRPVFAGKPLAMAPAACVLGTDTVYIERFRFYLSAVELVFADGLVYREKDSYHLLDASDSASLRIPLADVPSGKVSKIKFYIGVDSVASVSGALSGALDPVKGMYWAWNSGYINAKLEGSCKAPPGHRPYPFEFHIGGYMQPFYAIRTVELQLPAPSASTIVLCADAAAWLQQVDLHKENSVVIPGAEAMIVADRYSKMFSLAK